MTSPAVPVSVLPEPQPPAPPSRAERTLDGVLRVVGGVVAVWAGVLVALLDLIFATWAWETVQGRSGGAQALVGIGLAVAGIAAVAASTVLLGWFAHSSTGSRWAVALAAVPWFLVIVVGGFRTTEGDLALAGDNVLGLALIVTGAVTFAVLGFRHLVAPPPAPS
ncbi:hypothetical protein O7602_03350 [Micromonospora sp. WMMD1128]|uniref:hypothetical protein n=1 Tax=unclassified Micromonospora TaxID=2617518 RepID=UPI00248BD013|nr:MULTISPECIES: hypothetical protein [unclassified Micromonospora]WBB74606.1 hypothetical protein O7602_03350 [Micromonospora sp. WMMD1128]WFE32023.1 hypothetical protein O7613_20860 [Micromonospora sp. WMMD975]